MLHFLNIYMKIEENSYVSNLDYHYSKCGAIMIYKKLINFEIIKHNFQLIISYLVISWSIIWIKICVNQIIHCVNQNTWIHYLRTLPQRVHMETGFLFFLIFKISNTFTYPHPSITHAGILPLLIGFFVIDSSL